MKQGSSYFTPITYFQRNGKQFRLQGVTSPEVMANVDLPIPSRRQAVGPKAFSYLFQRLDLQLRTTGSLRSNMHETCRTRSVTLEFEVENTPSTNICTTSQ
ncbi:hypothetical protein PR048_021983, partial [Dryococelus australis]